tara:strand:+ start:108 stop:1322 length:1215 start_codon:yes stop_codon:yes gene_type:complete
MAQLNITVDTEILHGLFTSNGRDEAFSKFLEIILNQVLDAQSVEQLGAERYERNDNRVGYRNGYRERDLTTRIGTITLRVPRHRDGEFNTDMFNRYQRSEQALILAMIEMVINGVSTRKIKMVTEELCGKSFSKSTISSLCQQLDPIVEAFRNRPLEKHYPFVVVDALYIKVRENGRVRSKGLLIAKGVNENGYREILGFQLSDSESKSSWGELFSNLKNRGLENVDLVVSDDHKGLVSAIQKHFQDASWQRCQTHFSRNVLDATPKKLQPEIKELLRQMYDATNIENARSIRDQIIELYEEKAPKAIAVLESGFDDVMAVICLPLKYRKRLRTTNSIERLNEEIRRRERVIRIFPNADSAIRLIGALLIEQDEKWSTGRKYFEMDDYYVFLKEQTSDKNQPAA